MDPLVEDRVKDQRTADANSAGSYGMQSPEGIGQRRGTPGAECKILRTRESEGSNTIGGGKTEARVVLN